MERLTIGEVLKPQGIRGELKIKTFTDFPEDVKAFGTVYIDEKPYKILSFRAGEGGFAYLGSKMFEALSNNNINIKMISTSEIKISCIINRDDADKAVSAIHDMLFD